MASAAGASAPCPPPPQQQQQGGASSSQPVVGRRRVHHSVGREVVVTYEEEAEDGATVMVRYYGQVREHDPEQGMFVVFDGFPEDEAAWVEECGEDEWAWKEAADEVCIECIECNEDDEDDEDEGDQTNWKPVVRRASSQWCSGFSITKVGCGAPTCLGCQLASSVLEPGPCTFPGCQHECTATDMLIYQGVCWRHRGGRCTFPGCQHECTAEDMAREGGVCVRCRKGEGTLRVGYRNASNPRWTPEDKASLCELAEKNTVGGKVQWDAFKHLLPGGRSVESAAAAYKRVRAATPAPASSKRPKTGGKGKRGA